jgi:site-specific DNA-methyltransferase (adenine-specific)
MIDLIHGECLGELKNIKTGSIDLVLTSPPYNMNLRIRDGKYCSRQIVKELTTKYSNFDDNKPMEEYFDFNKRVIAELLRVSDLVFYNLQILTGNKPAIFKLIGEFSSSIKEFIVWDKCTAQPAIGKGVMNSQFEIIIVFQKTTPQSRSFKDPEFGRGTLSNLWKIKRGKKIHKSHGAVFPIELAEKVLLNFSKVGSTVLDPFMGVGTTLLAAKNTDRNGIGIELDKGYFDIARERLL